MGDPKKRRKKYSAPAQKWEKSRIEAELILTREYGLKNKREIRKADAKLRNFKSQAKRLVALTTPQAQKERTQLLTKLKSLSLIKEDASMDNILDLTLNNLLDRRLQTVLFKKGLTKTVKSARQFIVHGHVLVNDIKMTVPGYLVNVQEEQHLSYALNSSFVDNMHPERLPSAPKKPRPKKEVRRFRRR
ncbi:MAG: 30S ribosomal protein S4 [Nanoarchaeota archaeon]|nr:30S ribosomal protein S4 [Nanoarchaeota archaeon]